MQPLTATSQPRGLAPPSRRLLRISEVCAIVGVSRAMIYKSMKHRTAPFPKPVKIGAVARWPQDDIEAWVVRLREAKERRA